LAIAGPQDDPSTWCAPYPSRAAASIPLRARFFNGLLAYFRSDVGGVVLDADALMKHLKAADENQLPLAERIAVEAGFLEKDERPNKWQQLVRDDDDPG
jgi:hypothetical protein